jgi:hypothetical protein
MSPLLLEIERSIQTLSPEEQLWLLERIANHLRKKTHADAWLVEANDLEDQLVAMASDPAIQAELVAIEESYQK